MKRKAMLLLACTMIIMNIFVFLYLDMILKQDISVFVVQVGRYDQQENADHTIAQLGELGYEGYCYQDDNYVVIAQIVFQQDEADRMAAELAQKGLTCVVKEYMVDSQYETEIDQKQYENVYKELK